MDGRTRARADEKRRLRTPGTGAAAPSPAQSQVASPARPRPAVEPRAGKTPAPRIEAAPHVRTQIEERCGSDAVATTELLAALDGEQRRGWRVLPDTLPLVAALAAHARRALTPAVDPERVSDPEQVLALALCGSGPVRTLCAIAGCEPDQVASTPLAALVELHGGRFRFADARLQTHVLAAATMPERLRAHQRLASVLAEADEVDAALWHTARGAVSGDPCLVEPLLDQARTALRRGDAAVAWSRASEAVAHAPAGAPAQAGALLWAARAALCGGWVADALECGEAVLRIDGPDRGEATAVIVVAHTLRHGVVPAPDSLIPADARGDGFRHAAALGASFAAECGDHECSAAWLAAGRRFGNGDDARAALLAWCDVLAGGSESGPVGDGDAVQRVLHALSAGLEGDPDAGVRALTEPEAETPADPIVGLHAQVPLLRARYAVAEVVLHVWAGRIGVARAQLAAAAAALPVALAFGGLAVALSRRLDLAVDGELGPLSEDLAAAVPWAQEPDGFVDRAIDAYLRGRTDEAAVHMALWTDRGRPAEPLGLPGLDEIGPLGGTGMPEPPEATTARVLRERVRSARASSWRTDLDAVAEESRGIRSPFERARVEALLGATCAARGDRGGGVRHLRAARSLFEESGARAWCGMVDRRLRMLAARRQRAVIGIEDTIGPATSLEVCRAMWETVLTPRELEVALLMAEGRPNREIALALHVSVRTVEVHGGKIFAKLDVRTRHELTVLAHRTDQHL